MFVEHVVTTLVLIAGTQIRDPTGNAKQFNPGFNNWRLVIVRPNITDMLLQVSVDWTK